MHVPVAAAERVIARPAIAVIVGAIAAAYIIIAGPTSDRVISWAPSHCVKPVFPVNAVIARLAVDIVS